MSKCTTCGIEIEMPGRCRNCYEVELRLKEYIKSKKGRRFVAKILINTKVEYQCKLKTCTLNRNGVCDFIKNCSIVTILNCPRGFGKCR